MSTARPSKIVPRQGEGRPMPATRRVPNPRNRTTKTAGSHRDWIANQPCVLCELLGCTQSSKTDVHHVREGQGVAQRASDYLAIPLCHEGCHQGPQGIHGDRSLLRLAKVEELDLLAFVVAQMACRLHDTAFR